jgi:NADPH:quinone reductase-like Zn-dependent oxidoreductase
VTGTMMALRAHARGGPEQLVYESAPAPVPGPGEALVAVHAAAITFAELTWDLTWTTRAGRDRTPVIPSHEMSGAVAGIASYGLMRSGGRLVTLGAPPSQERAKDFGVHAMFFVVTPDPGELAQLAKLVDEGRLRPVVSQSVPLRDGRRAFESAGQPRPPGKTVLVVR